MNEENKGDNRAVNGVICLCCISSIAFIVLKLLGLVEWSWFWVLSPLWMPTALVALLVLVIIFVMLIASIAALFDTLK